MLVYDFDKAGKAHPVQHINADLAARVVTLGLLPYNLPQQSGPLARWPAAEEKFHAME